jgi:hypothetical protein
VVLKAFLKKSLAYTASRQNDESPADSEDYKQHLTHCILALDADDDIAMLSSAELCERRYLQLIEETWDEGLDTESVITTEVDKVETLVAENDGSKAILIEKLASILNPLYVLDKTLLRKKLDTAFWDKILETDSNEVFCFLASFYPTSPVLGKSLLYRLIKEKNKRLFTALLVARVMPDLEVLVYALKDADESYLTSLLDSNQYPQCVYDPAAFYSKLVTKNYIHHELYAYRRLHESRSRFYITPSSPKSVTHAFWLGCILGGVFGLGFCIAVLCSATFGGVILPVLSSMSLAMIKGLTLNLDGLFLAIHDLALTGYGDVLIPFVFIALVVLIALPYLLPPLLLMGVGSAVGAISLGMAAYVLDRSLSALSEAARFISALFSSKTPAKKEQPHEPLVTVQNDEGEAHQVPCAGPQRLISWV